MYIIILKVSEVKLQIKFKTGIDPDSQRLIYGGKQMEDDQSLQQYPTLKNGATIFLVLRLPGGFNTPTRHINPTLRRSKEPCMITYEQDCPDFPVFVMPCSHSMSPDGLMDYCWSEIGSRHSEILCPLCNTEWTIDVTCKYGCATMTEIHELEAGLSHNYCLSSQEVLECPSCSSFCERKNHTKLCVECIICTKKKGKIFYFCWQCLSKWESFPGDDKCGNTHCGDPGLTKQLQDAQMVKPLGLKVEVPNLRACPSCGSLIELKRRLQAHDLQTMKTRLLLCVSAYESIRKLVMR